MIRLVFVVSVLAVLALGACSGAAAVPSPAAVSSGTPGVKVETAGGSYTDINPAELKAMLDRKDFVFVNVHIPYEGEIAQTDAFIPYDALDENLGKLPADRDARIVLYCRSDRMSTIAALELVKKGFTNIWNLKGGMVAWETAGLPVIQK